MTPDRMPPIPLFAAFEDARAWTVMSWCRPWRWLTTLFGRHAMELSHPDGHVIRVSVSRDAQGFTGGQATWTVRLRRPDPANFGSVVASIPMSLPSGVAPGRLELPRPEHFLRDLHQSYGPSARARMHNLLKKVRWNCVSGLMDKDLFLIRKPFWDTFGLATHPHGAIMKLLPPDLHQDLKECMHIVFPDVVHPDVPSILLGTDIAVRIPMPQSLHERLQILHDA